MTLPIVITGTDTNIGKTVFAAGLVGVLKASYWKPVQSGLEEETDSQIVARLSGLGPACILPEAYRLLEPESPHLSARLEGITIEQNRLHLPRTAGPLVIEGAGGIFVPLNGSFLMADMFLRWDPKVVVCARTSLGTINHCLLTLRALQAMGFSKIVIAFIGDSHEENERIIPELGGVGSLGRLPWLDPLNMAELRSAFARHIDLSLLRELA